MSWTYFVQAEDGGNIKIGYTSRDPVCRLAGLQTGSPHKLILVGIIEGNVESELHRKFAHLRSHNEWFKNDKELVNYIERHCNVKNIVNIANQNVGNVSKVVKPKQIVKINRLILNKSKNLENFIDFDFMFNCDDTPFESLKEKDNGFDFLETMMCDANWTDGTNPCNIWEDVGPATLEEWNNYDEDEKELRLNSVDITPEEWGKLDKEKQESILYDIYNKDLEENNGILCEMDVMRNIASFIAETEAATVHFGRHINLFNKVAVSSKLRSVIFFCSAISSNTKKSFISELAHLCYDMSEFSDWNFIVVDEDNEKYVSLYTLALSLSVKDTANPWVYENPNYEFIFPIEQLRAN
jgi:hypothetical protein